MEELRVAELLEAINALGNFAHCAAAACADFQAPGIAFDCPVSNWTELVGKAESAERLCLKNVLPASHESSAELLKLIREHAQPLPRTFKGEQAVGWTRMDVERIKTFSDQLGGRVVAELKKRFVFEMSFKEAALYEAKEPLLDPATLALFPDAADDLIEAQKCLALGRATACVFHLMRAVEEIAFVLVKSFQSPFNDKGDRLALGGLFKAVEAKVHGMPYGSEKDAWSKVAGLMSSLNRGDRIKVAHPGRFYSDPQAEGEIAHVRLFAEEVAELLRQ